MRCPKCAHLEDKVIDSRTIKSGGAIRRRRMCLSCAHRFTTYEEVVRASLRIVKRDGRNEDLDRKKLLGGVLRACEKRPISSQEVEAMVDDIVSELEREYEREVPSTVLGKKVMDRLERVDEVAFVRFASVYRRFRDVSQFLSEVESLIGRE
jgi:transcriptional repressor NrdR